VHVDPEMFPPAPVPESYRARLRCTKWVEGRRSASGGRPSAIPLKHCPDRQAVKSCI